MASSISTGGASISVATLVPIVNWALAGFGHPIPETVPYLIAAGVITGAHALYNWATAPKASAAPAAAPAQPAPAVQPKGDTP